MVRADRLPAVSDGIGRTALLHHLRGVPAAVCAQESFALGIKASQRLGTGEVGKMIAALAVFGLVIDHAAFDLDLPGVEIALEIGGVILGIPQAEFDR